MADMEMIPITGSSQISALGYDPATKTMRVQFLYNGAVYEYSDVPQDAFDAVASAPSVGSAFNSLIKNGGYAYQKLS